MKKLVCWLTALALLLSCAGGLAETADGNEKTAFLQITGDAPVPVYEKITDTEKADELQPGQLCGLVDDITTEAGVRWYQIIYLNQAKKSAMGFIRPEYAHQLTLAEFKALTADSAKANEAMDLLDAVNSNLKAADGNDTQAAAGSKANHAEGSQDAKAGTDLFREFYNTAMKALDQVFHMDITGAIGEVTGQARDLAGKAVDLGLDVLDSTLGGAKDLITDVGRDAEQKIAAAAPEIAKKVGEALGAAKDGIGKAGDQAKNGIDKIRETAGEGISDISQAASLALLVIGSAARYGLSEVSTAARETIADLGDRAENEISRTVPGMTEDLEELLAEMKDRISGLKDTAGETLGTWVDDINKLFDEDADKEPEKPISDDLEAKLEKLQDNLSKSTEDVSTALQAASEKIEEGGLLGFAAQLLQTLNQNDADAWADFWKPASD